MLASNVPTKLVETFAQNAGTSYVRTIPPTTTTPGQASLDQGFPAECFLPLASGGYRPDGRDFNGILKMLSAWVMWQAAGGPVVFDGSFASSVGGYPQGAILNAASGQGFWVSTADSNTTNPDTGGANWTSLLQALLSAAGLTASLTLPAGYVQLPVPGSTAKFTAQWNINLTTSASGEITWTYPVAFPNHIAAVCLTPAINAAGGFATYSTASTTAVNIGGWNNNTTRAAFGVSAFAMGF